MEIYTRHHSVDHKLLSSEISDIAARILKKNKKVTVVRIRHDSANIDSNGICRSDFFVQIVITKGTNTDSEKAAWIDSVWQLMSLHLQINPELGTNCISIIENTDLSWGYNGITQSERAGAFQRKGQP